MKAARFHAPRDVRLEDVDVASPAKGEVTIKVIASNMCGTDLKTYLRGHPLVKPPITMGHEYVGKVIEVGRTVTKFRRGDSVIASNSCPCFHCEMCQRGSYSLCTKIPDNLVGFSVPGSYAEYMIIPPNIVAKNTYALPKKPSPEELACAEPLASVMHALARVPLRSGMTAVVVGSGALGLMFLQLLKLRGVKVIMTNRSKERLRIAERLGADRVLEAEDTGVAEQVKIETKGVGPDLVVEAVGKRETWEESFRLVREGGTVMMFGGCASGTVVSFDAGKIHYGEVTLVGSFHHEPTSFKTAINSIMNGEVDMKPIITNSLPLDRIDQAFKLMEERRALKVCVKP